MTDNNRLQSLAADHLEHFDFDFGDSGMMILISDTAPPKVKDMVKSVCGSCNQDSLVQIYEALNAVVESDNPDYCEIDEKVCGTDVYCQLIKYLKTK